MDQSFRVPDRFEKIDPNEFIGLYELAQRAGMRTINSPDPRNYQVALHANDGTESKFCFADNPVNRAGVTIKQEYGADPAIFMSIMARLFAFMDICQNHMDRFEQFVRRNDKGEADEIDHAVIKAAATTPLDRGMKFDIEQFCLEVHLHKQQEEGQQ